MPIITFLPSQKKIQVEQGTSLYDAARSMGLPVAASCSAEFICGKCNMQIITGKEAVSIQTEAEQALLRREKRPMTDRISCRTLVYGDCTVTTRYW